MRISLAFSVLFTAAILSGCAGHDPFRDNIEELIRCERRAMEQPELTCQQVNDLQADCTRLYEMRRRPTDVELANWDALGRAGSK